MSKLLVVFGATGYQGSSVVNFVLDDPDLSKQFRIRALSRDPNKPASQDLAKKGVEVVAAELDDKTSIEKAVQGAHTVFAMTNSLYDRAYAYDREVAQGKCIADACVAAGVDYIIWSSIPHVTKGSGGKLSNCIIFDSKADVETYIRGLPIKSAHFWPGHFMTNFQTQFKPQPNDDGTYVVRHALNADTQVPFIDTEADTGKWIGAILADPEKYNGKAIAASTKFYTYPEACEIMGSALGKTITYQQIPDEALKGFLPPTINDEILQMAQWIRDYGYYGVNQKQELEWGAAQARGKLTTFEEHIKAHPIALD